MLNQLLHATNRWRNFGRTNGVRANNKKIFLRDSVEVGTENNPLQLWLLQEAISFLYNEGQRVTVSSEAAC